LRTVENYMHYFHVSGLLGSEKQCGCENSHTTEMKFSKIPQKS
jgi:hypothetical protein